MPWARLIKGPPHHRPRLQMTEDQPVWICNGPWRRPGRPADEMASLSVARSLDQPPTGGRTPLAGELLQQRRFPRTAGAESHSGTQQPRAAAKRSRLRSAAAVVGGLQQVVAELDGAGGLAAGSSGAHGPRWEQCFQCGQE